MLEIHSQFKRKGEMFELALLVTTVLFYFHEKNLNMQVNTQT